MDEVKVNGNGPLSWRDVYHAVEASESRVLEAISGVDEKLTKVTDDHEERIRSSEKRIGFFADREKGISATFGSLRNLVILTAAIVGGLAAATTMVLNMAAFGRP